MVRSQLQFKFVLIPAMFLAANNLHAVANSETCPYAERVVIAGNRGALEQVSYIAKTVNRKGEVGTTRVSIAFGRDEGRAICRACGYEEMASNSHRDIEGSDGLYEKVMLIRNGAFVMTDNKLQVFTRVICEK